MMLDGSVHKPPTNSYETVNKQNESKNKQTQDSLCPCLRLCGFVHPPDPKTLG